MAPTRAWGYAATGNAASPERRDNASVAVLHALLDCSGRAYAGARRRDRAPGRLGAGLCALSVSRSTACACAGAPRPRGRRSAVADLSRLGGSFRRSPGGIVTLAFITCQRCHPSVRSHEQNQSFASQAVGRELPEKCLYWAKVTMPRRGALSAQSSAPR